VVGKQEVGLTLRTSGLSAAEDWWNDCRAAPSSPFCNCTRPISNQAIGFEASTLTQTLLLGGTKLYAACAARRRLTGHSKADLCDFPEGNQTVVSKGQVWIRITPPLETDILVTRSFVVLVNAIMLHWGFSFPLAMGSLIA
jgi:hypothetical protein